ncbi:MAG: DUF1801 domain-containing protein [Bacteroidota bacterium]|jgi:hypothetical protein
MQSKADTIERYLNELDDERKSVLAELHQRIIQVLPKGFEATMQYGMISYVVPHRMYSAGYHCKPSDPLPFASLASQKNSISIYHMGMYADEELMRWFTTEYGKKYAAKPDMGKSCIRFKKIHQIPVDLIAELFSKMQVNEWIALYEKNIKR